jgi:short-subunit dehydrogenase
VRRFVPESVLITGATGGIGSALAEAYARPGIELVLHGRNEAQLGRLAERCRAFGAAVRTRALDLRDRAALRSWLRALSDELPLDLAIVNAGVNTNIGPDRSGERWEAVEELLDVNVRASIATVEALLPAMRARGRGQIALISSLAAWYGLPITPSYCASKAALKAMCREFPGPKPFLWPAERAARAIKRGLEQGRPRISFPFPLNLGSWFLSVLPPSVSERLLALLRYGG